VLLSAGSRPTRTFLDWEAAKLEVSPGETMNLVVDRGGRERQIAVAVGDLPTASAERVSVLGDMDLITVTPAVRQERRLQADEGALIYRLGERTRSVTRLREGDVIIQINRQRITSADDVREYFGGLRGRSAVRVYVVRDGSRGYAEFYVQ
jgi:serine protease Do